MKNFVIRRCLFWISIVVLSMVYARSNAQIIDGVVLDYDTRKPVPFSSIYFSDAYRGTTADSVGRFHLNIQQFSGQDLIVSCMGYKSEIIHDYSPGNFHEIYLKAQTQMLDDVVIHGDPAAWKRNLKIFEESFLGRTSNAKRCRIENPDDLYLTYDKVSRILTATSSKPLQIVNKALGFRITYFLGEFTRTEERIFYSGHSIFQDLPVTSRRERRAIKKRRADAYQGSRMHFFRTLWGNDFQRSGFVAYDHKSGGKVNLTGHVKSAEDNTKYLAYPNALNIVYSKKRVSYLSFGDVKQILFKENGFFDPSTNSWFGAMSEQRIGDLLPFEY
jgi:hypothetical protein